MKDLTTGSPAGRMLNFALPVALGNIFQLCYSLADTRVVGTFLGEGALAAVGATTSISTLFIGFLTGLMNGFAILIARGFGAGDEKSVRRYAAGSLLLGSLIAALITVLCVGLLYPILGILNVPQELTQQAASYIRVVLLGLLVTMLYNGCAAILRAVGDTTAPLLFLVIAAILNVGLDILFVVPLHMGVAGAAIATVLAQLVSVVLSLGYMVTRYPMFRFRAADFRVSGGEIRQLLSSGLSMAAMMSLVYFGTLALQCAINTFGQDIIVAHTAARKLTEFFMLPFSVMGVTMATYCGQNMGAGKLDRIRVGIRQSLAITWIWSIGMMILSWTVAKELAWLVTGASKTEVLETAALYLKVDTLFYFAPAAIGILRNALQGMGEHQVPVFSSMIELVGKVVAALVLARLFGYWGIIAAEPIVWILMVIPLIVSVRKHLYREGKKDD